MMFLDIIWKTVFSGYGIILIPLFALEIIIIAWEAKRKPQQEDKE